MSQDEKLLAEFEALERKITAQIRKHEETLTAQNAAISVELSSVMEKMQDIQTIMSNVEIVRGLLEKYAYGSTEHDADTASESSAAGGEAKQPKIKIARPRTTASKKRAPNKRQVFISAYCEGNEELMKHIPEDLRNHAEDRHSDLNASDDVKNKKIATTVYDILNKGDKILKEVGISDGQKIINDFKVYYLNQQNTETEGLEKDKDSEDGAE